MTDNRHQKDVAHAQPRDVYADDQGKLWRVIAVCGEPTVTMQEIEPAYPGEGTQMEAGVSSLTWKGFKLVSRPK